MNYLKVAIIQEWLVTVGGSDKVVKAILDVFPDAISKGVENNCKHLVDNVTGHECEVVCDFSFRPEK